jgi:hypothetical protein
MADVQISPYYRRKYKLTIYDSSGKDLILSDSDFGEEALEFTFRTQKTVMQGGGLFFCDIVAYNCNADTEAFIIEYGNRVTLEAGYIEGNYGTIFDGRVFHAIRQRENVVDYKLMIRVVDGISVITQNIVSGTIASGSNQQAQLNTIAQKAKNQFQYGYISDNLKDQTLPRGKVYFGDARKYLRQISQDSNAQFCCGDGKIHIGKFSDNSSDDFFEYDQYTGIIGTPQAVDSSVNFRVLLNPYIQAKANFQRVKLVDTWINQNLLQYGKYPTVITNGFYNIYGVSHVGNSRGGDWYTDIQADAANAKIASLKQIGVGRTVN